MKKLLIFLALLIPAIAQADLVYNNGTLVTNNGEPVVICTYGVVTVAGGTLANSKVDGKHLHVTANANLYNVTQTWCPCLVDNAVTATVTNFAGWNPSGDNFTFTGTGAANVVTSAFSGAKPAGVGTDTTNQWSVADMGFTAVNALDYTLAAGSPLVDTGTDLGDVYDEDLIGTDQDDNGFAAVPTISVPADEATGISLYPTLTASAFAVSGAWDIGCYALVAATHTASEWEICVSGNGWAANVVDSGEDAVNLESYTVSTRLSARTAYDLRVRYFTDAGYSGWSGTIDFTTQGGGRGAGRSGMGMQQH